MGILRNVHDIIVKIKHVPDERPIIPDMPNRFPELNAAWMASAERTWVQRCET